MTDCRAVMDLVLQGWSVRQICSTLRCSHTTGECLMVCVWVPNLHEEMDQNDYCGTTRSG